ncbi:MAG: PD-(D/E)XK nuclease family protein [Clostridiales Family XIII bacterium]|nr:PD-(D/E)XK nuclease family protein [Clostridiales Family XIII bacterium]
MLNYHSFTVQREFHNIDLFLLSTEAKVVICIENKIYSSEHSKQLERYNKIVEKSYPEYKRYFIFLSPYGDESSGPEIWKPLGYDVVAKIIENAMENKSTSSSGLQICWRTARVSILLKR